MDSLIFGLWMCHKTRHFGLGIRQYTGDEGQVQFSFDNLIREFSIRRPITNPVTTDLMTRLDPTTAVVKLLSALSDI